jgi:hypothetical protein
MPIGMAATSWGTYGRSTPSSCAPAAQLIHIPTATSPDARRGGANALYGFDSVGPTVYPPSWKDVTYCNNEWVSDFACEGI